ncbi:uncharacterized protein FOMMEDRAFT_169398 [Fomitiporia mediterranea MF3/22]|uniref:uncharacterized protein n=1 Tax=Fomitiporia mediterranea (strain MF3/22) TaxID=694068 RepID=UPI0004408832|nr:uncharacterized protein FOMMEDRAFT_169398 [Fomitiporia mediterranea MF3/22]EJD01238.1 hypothetical protein FOMMEDRAFT_169398 [Fomitiporia mediterranea MF3/22]
MVEPALPSPTEAPPPAYEISQLDFEEKLVIATERSLDLSDHNYEQAYNASKADTKFMSDDAGQSNVEAHQFASASASAQSSSVRPLSFRRKSRKSDGSGESVGAKERPSWLEETRVDASTSNSSASVRRLPSEPEEPHGHDDGPSQHVLPDESSEEDHSMPPPPFAPIDTSLDGPAYERYPSQDARPRRTDGPTIVMSYTDQDVGASPPPSPPQSPVVRNTSPNIHRQRATSPQINPMTHGYQHAPQQSRLQVGNPAPRPRSTGAQRFVPPPPRLSFDPSVAYEGTRTSLFGQLPKEVNDVGQDARSLYSSAVAPLMSSQKSQISRPAPAPRAKRYAPSINSLSSEYDQNQTQQNMPSNRPFYSAQDYAASRTSVYTQASVNQFPQYPHVSQYQQMPQYPAQQNNARPPATIHQSSNQRWSTAPAPYQSTYYQR